MHRVPPSPRLRVLCMGFTLSGHAVPVVGRREGVPPAPKSLTVVTAGETVLFWFLQGSEGAQPLNLSAKPKASESKSPNSPPTSPQVPAAAAATKLGPAGSMKHSAVPSSIGGPPTRVSSIGKWTQVVNHRKSQLQSEESIMLLFMVLLLHVVQHNK